MLAEETGGIAVVNQNDFDKALKRIDAETSDYYVLGYYSKNPDIAEAPPAVEVSVTRAGSTVVVAQGIRAQAAAGARRRLTQAVACPTASELACGVFVVAASAGTRCRRAARSSAASRVRVTASRQIAFRRYPTPMKSTPSRAHATAVLPSPVNGSIASSIRDSPWSRRHCSGSRDGNVAGCGRSRSRRWMVSYGMNHVLPRQRTPSAAAAPAADVRLILIRDAERQAVERRRPGRREMKHELVAVVEEAIAVDRLVVADRQVAVEPGRRAGQLRSIAIDLTQ